jgi:hypothetical protein
MISSGGRLQAPAVAFVGMANWHAAKNQFHQRHRKRSYLATYDE